MLAIVQVDMTLIDDDQLVKRDLKALLPFLAERVGGDARDNLFVFGELRLIFGLVATGMPLANELLIPLMALLGPIGT